MTNFTVSAITLGDGNVFYLEKSLAAGRFAINMQEEAAVMYKRNIFIHFFTCEALFRNGKEVRKFK